MFLLEKIRGIWELLCWKNAFFFLALKNIELNI